MARTTDQPRLSKLDPHEVTESILRVLTDHAHEVSFFLGRTNFEGDTGWLRNHLQQLVEFAQGRLRHPPTAFFEYLTFRLTHNLLTSAWEAKRGARVHPGP